MSQNKNNSKTTSTFAYPLQLQKLDLDYKEQHALAITLANKPAKTLLWDVLIRGTKDRSDMQGHTDALKLKLANWVDDMTKINPQSQISFLRNGLVTLEGEVQSILDWRKHYIETSSFNTRYRLVQVMTLLPFFIGKRYKFRRAFQTFILANMFLCPGNIRGFLQYDYLLNPQQHFQPDQQEPQSKIVSLKKDLESVQQEINLNLQQLKSGINDESDSSYKDEK